MKGKSMGTNGQDLRELTVKITVDEIDDRTRAVARMPWKSRELVGIGQVCLDPGDHFPDRVGGELAVARALSNVIRQLDGAAAADIEAVTGESVSVR